MAQRKPYARLPESPGVYLMKDRCGRVLYIGKAGNLRRRVASYFTKPNNYRVEKLVGEIGKIDYKKTDTALEALILESKLIKKFSPPYNIREKDDKSFLYIEFTKEKFPCLLLVRGKDLPSHKKEGERRTPHRAGGSGVVFGPFTSASNIREALRILRQIFPWGAHGAKSEERKEKSAQKPCFDYQIGLCPGTCIGAINKRDYLKNIRNLKFIFQGKKEKILKSLEKDMKIFSRKLEFEKAEKVRRQILALKYIQDVALIGDSDLNPKSYILNSNFRIEGYDISNISGTSVVGSMVVFTGGKPDKSEYRKFKIRTFTEPNDVGMMKEVLRRRFKNDWPLPDLVLVDGGRGQVNAAKRVLLEFGLEIPVVGIAKGSERKRNDIIGLVPRGVSIRELVQVRDEAHRFAISYHRKLRGRTFVQ